MNYQVYKVGGAVRDELLGRQVKDIDWVIVGATSNLLLSEGYLQVGKDFPVFLHPKTKEEYALARTERKKGHGYSGFEVFATPDVTLEEDLLRRDLTINAMAMDMSGQIYDPYHGHEDLEKRLLRHVSPAFEEDPLRVLRLARFYARFYEEGFTVADETILLVHKMIDSGELNHLVVERIWLETHKALEEKHAIEYFVILNQLGALRIIFPLMMPCFVAENDNNLKHVFKTVSVAIAEQRPMHERVALLLMMLGNIKEIQQFAKEYRLSAHEKNAAEKLYQWKDWFETVHSEPEEWLDLLLGLDSFRKPEQLMSFLDCVCIIQKTLGKKVRFDQVKNKLLEIYHSLQEIDIKLLINGVLSSEIPEKIKSHRLSLINSLIKD